MFDTANILFFKHARKILIFSVFTLWISTAEGTKDFRRTRPRWPHAAEVCRLWFQMVEARLIASLQSSFHHQFLGHNGTVLVHDAQQIHALRQASQVDFVGVLGRFQQLA